MNIRKWFVIATGLSLALCLGTPVLHAQAIPFDLEIGYRWLDVDGNESMYRSQIDEQSGVLLRTFTLTTVDFNGRTSLVDRFRIDGSELGAGPLGSVRIEAGRSGVYDLRLRYRTADAFSALPAFANPLLGAGIVPGQHTFDRTRTMIDADLELRPFSAVTPFVGYSRNRYDGPGQTTLNIGQDEFRLLSDVNETDEEFRIGAAFRFDRVQGQVTQGWRSFDGTESLALVPGAGGGNNPGPVAGRPVSADVITRESRTDADTPFTSMFVTGQVTSRLRLIGNYARFSAEQDGLESELASGSFASFALGRFFTGLSEDVSARAKNTTWRGGGRAEIRLTDTIDLLAGYQREHRELDGFALIHTIYRDSITFGGADRRDLEEILRAESSFERDEDVVSAALSARAIGPFGFRIGLSEARQDVTVAPDLSEIVVPGAQGGDFDRRIRTFDASTTYTRGALTLGASLRRDRADQPVLRTDYLDRDRLRFRAAWRTPGNLLRTGVTAERIDQENDRTGIGYDARSRQLGGDIELAPLASVRLRGSYSRFENDSAISIRRPENFLIETSIHTEDGEAIEAGLSLFVRKVSLDASFGRFENEGVLPFEIDRGRARLSLDLFTSGGIALEWSRDEYRESALPLADFDATRYGLYVRWRQ
ncbi:MAG TPA: hypothetical protein VMT00_07985 [Thermoanaerobaculia bacterium]|nr:hypothetical protein [Thermoanaerobaculia bacterium]